MVPGKNATFACAYGKQNVSILINSIFSVIQHYLGSVFFPPDNITLNPANRWISLSDFQTGIDVAAYATLDTEQLISCTRTAPC